MTKKQSTRRRFLQMLGLSVGAGLVSKSAIASIIDQTEIKKLNPEQQKFMLRYEAWMTEFIEVIRIQKTEPDNIENHKKMISLTEISEGFKPELDVYMKDETFSLIYTMAIERMKKEI